MKRFITLCVVLSMIYATVALPKPTVVVDDVKELEERKEAALQKKANATEAECEEGSNNSTVSEQLTDKRVKRKAAAVAGAVIAVSKFTIGILQEILRILRCIERKIAIGVGNESGHTWKSLGIYYSSGTSDVDIPYKVENGEAVLYSARKTEGPVARGAVGVFAYEMSDGNTLGVLYHVPFDYNLYSNLWNAKVYPGIKRASESMYDDLYDDSKPFKADDWHVQYLGYGLKIRGFMTSSSKATLQIYVNKTNVPDFDIPAPVGNTSKQQNNFGFYTVLFLALIPCLCIIEH